MDRLLANEVPAHDEEQEDDWSPLEALAKGGLHWLEQVDARNCEHLRSAISTLDRALFALPMTPLHDNPQAHVIGRLLRLLRSAYVQLHGGAIKGN